MLFSIFNVSIYPKSVKSCLKRTNRIYITNYIWYTVYCAVISLTLAPTARHTVRDCYIHAYPY